MRCARVGQGEDKVLVALLDRVVDVVFMDSALGDLVFAFSRSFLASGGSWEP